LIFYVLSQKLDEAHAYGRIFKTAIIDGKFRHVVTDGVPPEVRNWAATQQTIAEVERRKGLTDQDLKNSLILLFKRLNPEMLSDEEKDRYAELDLRFGI